MRASGMIALLALLATASARAEDQTGDVQAGRALALRVCTPCHVVLPDQEMAPILQPPAPSFRAIANRPRTTEESLRRFLAETHSSISNVKGMPSPELRGEQIRQAATFLMSLKTPR